jgi:hypothetical protein
MPFKDREDRNEAQRRRRDASRGLPPPLPPPGHHPGEGEEGEPVAPLPVTSAAEVLVVLAEAINAARADPRASPQVKARSVGFLCSIALKALEQGTLADEVAELKQLLGAQK